MAKLCITIFNLFIVRRSLYTPLWSGKNWMEKATFFLPLFFLLKAILNWSSTLIKQKLCFSSTSPTPSIRLVAAIFSTLWCSRRAGTHAGKALFFLFILGGVIKLYNTMYWIVHLFFDLFDYARNLKSLKHCKSRSDVYGKSICHRSLFNIYSIDSQETNFQIMP